MTLSDLRDSGLLDETRGHFSFWDPNELIARDVPAEMAFSLTKLWVSDGSMLYRWQGKFVEACVAVRHASLIDALCELFSVDPAIGRGFTGAGFAMDAQLEALKNLAQSDPG